MTESRGLRTRQLSRRVPRFAAQTSRSRAVASQHWTVAGASLVLTGQPGRTRVSGGSRSRPKPRSRGSLGASRGPRPVLVLLPSSVRNHLPCSSLALRTRRRRLRESTALRTVSWRLAARSRRPFRLLDPLSSCAWGLRLSWRWWTSKGHPRRSRRRSAPSTVVALDDRWPFSLFLGSLVICSLVRATIVSGSYLLGRTPVNQVGRLSSGQNVSRREKA